MYFNGRNSTKVVLHVWSTLYTIIERNDTLHVLWLLTDCLWAHPLCVFLIHCTQCTIRATDGFKVKWSIVVVFLLISNNPYYSAFFCLIALLLSSIIWYFAKATQNIHYVSITYSVAIQEICRWGFYKLLNRAEEGLNVVSKNPKSPFNRPVFAFGECP